MKPLYPQDIHTSALRPFARTEHIVSLDGIRGIAALVVVIYHLQVLFHLPDFKGFLAVDLFFVLSGWVMAHSYESRIVNGMPFRQFMVQRMARLYPLYLVALLAAFLVQGMKMFRGTATANLTCAAPNLLMLPCLQEAPAAFPLNSPSWSIFSEIVVNVIWYFTTRMGLHTLRWKIAANLAFAIVSWVVIAGCGRYLNGYNNSDIHEGLLRAGLGFTSGLVLHTCRRNFLVAIYFLALSCVAMLMLNSHAFNHDLSQDLMLTLAGFPILIWLVVRLRPALLENRIAAWLGNISYALYLLHIPLREITSKLTLMASSRLGLDATLFEALLFMTGLLIVCTISFSKFEGHARRWVNSKLQKTKQAASSPATAYT